MSKIIKIPLEGGFDNQNEPSSVGVSLTAMENLHNLSRGALVQREGYGTPTEIGGGSNDKLILDIEYWLKDTTLWWLAYDRILGQINRLSDDFTTATNLSTIHQTTATQTVGTGNTLIVEAHEWTGTEPTKYYFKITTAGTPDKYSISVDDDTYTNEEDVVTSSTAVPGASSLKAYWGSTTSSALNDKWEVTVYPIPKRIGVSNWGNAVRFAYGLYHDPSIYQYIDRKFFHDGTVFMYEPSADYHYDIAYPILPTTWAYEPLDGSTGISGSLQSGGNLTASRDYYYKITAVFDGSQETIIPDEKFGPLTTDGSNKTCLLKLKLDTNNYNKRITAINIYRASTTGATPSKTAYRLIRTLSLTDTQSSWINSSQGYLGRKIYAYGLDWNPASVVASTGFNLATESSANGSSPGTAFTIPTDAKFLWLSNEFNDVSGVGGTDYWNTATPVLYYWYQSANLKNMSGSFTDWDDDIKSSTITIPEEVSATANTLSVKLGADCDGETCYFSGGFCFLFCILLRAINADTEAEISPYQRVWSAQCSRADAGCCDADENYTSSAYDFDIGTESSIKLQAKIVSGHPTDNGGLCSGGG